MWTYSTKRFRTTISSRTSETQETNRAWALVIVISSARAAHKAFLSSRLAKEPISLAGRKVWQSPSS